MIGLEVNDVAVVEQKQVLEQALSTNPKTQKALQKLIRQVILETRARIVASIQFQNRDPHQSRRAVRSSVYKQILGANINIYNGRRAHGRQNVPQSRTLREGQRGGNRVKPMQHTIDIQNYAPQDRGFILRFVNSGTTTRTAGTRGGHLGGNRGSISARNFFQPVGERALVQATDHLANLIDTELDKILNKTT